MPPAGRVAGHLGIASRQGRFGHARNHLGADGAVLKPAASLRPRRFRCLRNERACIASLMRCSMNHALFCVIRMARESSYELTPFLLLVMSQMATNHLSSPIGESSKIVPTLTENWRFRWCGLALHSQRR